MHDGRDEEGKASGAATLPLSRIMSVVSALVAKELVLSGVSSPDLVVKELILSGILITKQLVLLVATLWQYFINFNFTIFLDAYNDVLKFVQSV